ncbi:hypothetical protein FB567DRAFT_166360 [Paraphoma chrysanthemicola]|uniref:Transcription factor domain-containing protein n=1 Tax=Paraphoma chrysanthemicola TaxID=798071 RepID=A0A8K0RFK4_9PLEO|nr:hypothetical protein FB567DRAFT_166360 [Paraphoma chrysanthemicola]
MVTSPESTGCSPHSLSSSIDEGDINPNLTPSETVAYRRSMGRRTNTQYAFIMQTGDESSTAVKNKLKTVRSHVMKNYLHQQQQRGVEELLDPNANRTRRKSKELARRSRSSSFDADPSSDGHTNTIVAGNTLQDRSRSAFHFFGPIFEISLADVAAASYETPAQIGAVGYGQFDSTDNLAGKARRYMQCIVVDSLLNSLGPSFETLNAKVEVVGSVQNALALCGSIIPPQAMFAVSLLAYGCAILTDWEEAQGHANALERLVETRGGLQALDVDLQRTVAWIVYCIAAANGTGPPFAPPIFQEHGTLTLAFFDDAQMKAWRTVKRFPKNSAFVYDVVVRMHRLGLATSADWHGNVDWRALSNLQFEAMHKALLIRSEAPWLETISRNTLSDELSIMFEVWALALPLFLWATTRHLRTRLGIDAPWAGQDIIISRVHHLLEDDSGHRSWPRGKSLEPILASLLYCVEACDFASPLRPWLIRTTRKVSDLLKLKELEDFRKVLDFFPSTEEYRLIRDAVWEELTQSMHQGLTPAMTFTAFD